MNVTLLHTIIILVLFLLYCGTIYAAPIVPEPSCYRLSSSQVNNRDLTDEGDKVVVDMYYVPEKYVQIMLYDDILEKGWFTVTVNHEYYIIVDQFHHVRVTQLEHEQQEQREVVDMLNANGTLVWMNHTIAFSVNTAFDVSTLMIERSNWWILGNNTNEIQLTVRRCDEDMIITNGTTGSDLQKELKHSRARYESRSIDVTVSNNGEMCKDLTGLYHRMLRYYQMEDIIYLSARWPLEMGYCIILLIMLWFVRERKLVTARVYLGLGLVALLITEFCYCTNNILRFFLNPKKFAKSATILTMVGSAFSTLAQCYYAVQIVRYTYVRNLYHAIVTGKSKYVRIHRIILSRITNIAVILFIWICYWTTIVFQYIFIKDRTAVFTVAMRLTFLISNIGIVGGLSIICLLCDMWLNKKTILEKGFEYFFNFDDPLYFRASMAMYVAGIGGGISMLIINLIIIPIVPVTVHTFGTHIALRILFLPVWWIIEYSLFMSVGGGFVILIEVWRKYIQVQPVPEQSSDKDDFIEEFLKIPAGLRMVEQFSEREFSSENIMMWKELVAYRVQGVMPIIEAKRIYDKYIAKNSDLEVNITDGLRETFHRLITQAENNSSNQQRLQKIEYEKLIELENAIKSNLRDTLSRLKRTTEYKNLADRLELTRNTIRRDFKLEV
jgi:hypothetical protein